MKNGNRQKKTEIKTGVTILWHSDYYDGPLTGIAQYNGEKVYFHVRKQYHSQKMSKQVYRTFDLFRMTKEQWDDILFWHEEFRLFVGTHCDYNSIDENGKPKRTIGDVHNISHEYVMEMFYDRYKAHQAEKGKPEDTICKEENFIGWVTYDVLFGETSF